MINDYYITITVIIFTYFIKIIIVIIIHISRLTFWEENLFVKTIILCCRRPIRIRGKMVRAVFHVNISRRT